MKFDWRNLSILTAALITPLLSSAWAPAVALGATNSRATGINGVACPSASVCFAVGGVSDDTGARLGLILKYTGGGWTSAVPSLPTNANSSPTTKLGAISCHSTSFCVALGTYLDNTNTVQGVALTYNGTAWHPSQLPLPTTAVANLQIGSGQFTCASTVLCVGAAIYGFPNNDFREQILVDHNGSWSISPTPVPPGGVANSAFSSAVSCWSTTACAAVGQYRATSIKYEGYIDTYKGGVWTSQLAPFPTKPLQKGDPEGAVQALSCVPSACTAVGTYTDAKNIDRGAIWKLSGSTWKATQALLPTGSSQPSLDTIDCSGAAVCSVAGSDTAKINGKSTESPIMLRESAGKWKASRAPLPPHAVRQSDLEFSMFACSSATSCIGGGSYQSTSTANGGLLESDSSGKGAGLVPPSLPANHSEAALYSGACLSSGTCFVGGDFLNAEFQDVGVLYSVTSGKVQMTLIPIPAGS